jgi:sec-independent protein translocase protein TatC
MVSVKKLREIRGYVVVVAFVIAAIVTPPDVISQFMLAVPLWVLYEVGLIVASRVTPRAADPDDADDIDDIDSDGSNASSKKSNKSD